MRSDRAAIALGVAISIAAAVRDPMAEAALPKRALGLLIAVVAIAFVLVRQRERVARPSWPVWAAFGALGLSALSMTWGSARGAFVLGTWAAGVGVAVAASMQGRHFAMRVARVVGVLLGAMASLHAIVTFASGARGLFVDGAQGNPNWLGLVLVATLPLALDAARTTRARWVRALAISSAVLQAGALGLCHARVAWIAIAIAAVVLGVRWLKKSRARRWVLAGAMTIVFVAGGLLGAGRARTIARTHAVTTAASEPYEAPTQVAFLGRLSIARTSLRAMRATLPFGAGLGRFSEAFADAQGEALAQMPPKNAARAYVHATTAHDDFLHVAVESGPLAMGLLLLAMIGLVRARWVAGSATALAIVIAGLGDDALRTPAVVLVLGLLFAALPNARRVLRAETASVLRVATIAACALLMVVATRGWLAARIVTQAETTVDPMVKAMRLARAVRIDPRSADASLQLGILRGSMVELRRARALEDDLATELAMVEVSLASGDLVTAEACARKGLGWNPGSARARIALGEVLRRSSRFDEAEAEARVAHLVAPGHPAVAELLERIGEARIAAVEED